MKILKTLCCLLLVVGCAKKNNNSTNDTSNVPTETVSKTPALSCMTQFLPEGRDGSYPLLRSVPDQDGFLNFSIILPSTKDAESKFWTPGYIGKSTERIYKGNKYPVYSGETPMTFQGDVRVDVDIKGLLGADETTLVKVSNENRKGDTTTLKTLDVGYYMVSINLIQAINGVDVESRKIEFPLYSQILVNRMFSFSFREDEYRTELRTDKGNLILATLRCRYEELSEEDIKRIKDGGQDALL